jgi:Cu/Ag efflux pump CusA
LHRHFKDERKGARLRVDDAASGDDAPARTICDATGSAAREERLRITSAGEIITCPKPSTSRSSVSLVRLSRAHVVERKVVVIVEGRGRDLSSVVKDIRERVASTVKLPSGYHIEYGGQFESAGRPVGNPPLRCDEE